MTAGTWGEYAGGFVRNMAISTAIGWGITYMFPGLQTARTAAGVATDVFANIAARSYDVTTCIGRFNVCYDACVGGGFWASGLGATGCSLAYTVCAWLEK